MSACNRMLVWRKIYRKSALGCYASLLTNIGRNTVLEVNEKSGRGSHKAMRKGPEGEAVVGSSDEIFSSEADYLDFLPSKNCKATNLCPLNKARDKLIRKFQPTQKHQG